MFFLSNNVWNIQALVAADANMLCGIMSLKVGLGFLLLANTFSPLYKIALRGAAL